MDAVTSVGGVRRQGFLVRPCVHPVERRLHGRPDVVWAVPAGSSMGLQGAARPLLDDVAAHLRSPVSAPSPGGPCARVPERFSRLACVRRTWLRPLGISLYPGRRAFPPTPG